MSRYISMRMTIVLLFIIGLFIPAVVTGQDESALQKIGVQLVVEEPGKNETYGTNIIKIDPRVGGGTKERPIRSSRGLTRVITYIDSVLPGSAADRAGLKRADQVTAVNGFVIYTAADADFEMTQAFTNKAESVEWSVARVNRASATPDSPAFPRLETFSVSLAGLHVDTVPNQLPSHPSYTEQVKTIQEHLRANGATRLAVDGVWNEETQEALRTFILALQSPNSWGNAWASPRDGRYTDGFAGYMRLKFIILRSSSNSDTIAAMNALKPFFEALDTLKAAGIYDPSTVKVEQPTPIETVQTMLKESVAETLSVDGVWSSATQEALTNFLQQLQQHQKWGQGWNDPIDDSYSTKLAQHLRSRLDEVERTETRTPATRDLRAFIVALDALKEQGVYREPEERASVVAPAPETGNPSATPARELSESDRSKATIVSWANGVLWQHADEWWCALPANAGSVCPSRMRQLQEDLIELHPRHYMFATLFGALCSPLGLGAILFTRGRSGLMSFILGFCAEIVEGVYAAYGEIATFGRVLDESGLIVGIIIAGTLTGSMAAWKNSSAFRTFATVCILVAVAAVAYSVYTTQK